MFEKIAYAADTVTPGGQGGSLMAFLPMYLMLFFILYFFMIRPQQKKQKELQDVVANLKKGDRVVTNGGIIGTVSSIQEKYIVLNAGDSETKLEILKSAIVGLYQ